MELWNVYTQNRDILSKKIEGIQSFITAYSLKSIMTSKIATTTNTKSKVDFKQSWPCEGSTADKYVWVKMRIVLISVMERNSKLLDPNYKYTCYYQNVMKFKGKV